jgi:dipeptidyl aminopeptidase/acylaminoacyl peptidase
VHGNLPPSARSNPAPALLATGLVLALGSSVGPAHAAFPGANGRIAYSEHLSEGGTDTQVELRTVRPDGRRNRLLLEAAYEPAFSPDGRRLAYSDEIVSSLVVARADGRGIRGLTPGLRGDQEAADGTPDWSPNGRRIVFTRHRPQEPAELRIYAGGGSRRLTEGADPAWSVTEEIAFWKAGGIYSIRPDGGGLRLIVERGHSPDWSPDGRRIAFVRGGRITIARRDGRTVRRLRRGREPAFSPDGRKLVYLDAVGNLATMSARGKRRRIVARPDAELGGELDGMDWQPLPRPSRRERRTDRVATRATDDLSARLSRCVPARCREHRPGLLAGRPARRGRLACHQPPPLPSSSVGPRIRYPHSGAASTAVRPPARSRRL